MKGAPRGLGRARTAVCLGCLAAALRTTAASISASSDESASSSEGDAVRDGGVAVRCAAVLPAPCCACFACCCCGFGRGGGVPVRAASTRLLLSCFACCCGAGELCFPCGPVGGLPALDKIAAPAVSDYVAYSDNTDRIKVEFSTPYRLR